ncbi:MAG: aldo/keto reductase [Burkholderiaceae bacterium]|nr:aldo/keto reductase [Microbacteriaceae bacterium]
MTKLSLPRLGYGAANVGNLYRALSDDEAAEVLEVAWDCGIRYFDTAPHYGLGLSERRLGAFLATKPRDEFVISTKVGRLLRPNPVGVGTTDLDNDFVVPGDTRREWDFSRDGIRRSLDESLGRLGLDRVDVLFLHDPERHDLCAGLDTAIPALAGLRDEGAVTAVGVGSMSTDALLASVSTGALDLLMVAGRLTLADQPALAEVVPECRRLGVGIVNASVFNSGLLATDDPGSTARFDYGGVSAELLERVRAIAVTCREFGVDLPTAALHYASRDGSVASVVVASSRPAQVRENAARVAGAVPEGLWPELVARGLIPA